MGMGSVKKRWSALLAEILGKHLTRGWVSSLSVGSAVRHTSRTTLETKHGEHLWCEPSERVAWFRDSLLRYTIGKRMTERDFGRLAKIKKDFSRITSLMKELRDHNGDVIPEPVMKQISEAHRILLHSFSTYCLWHEKITPPVGIERYSG